MYIPTYYYIHSCIHKIYYYVLAVTHNIHLSTRAVLYEPTLIHWGFAHRQPSNTHVFIKVVWPRVGKYNG